MGSVGKASEPHAGSEQVFPESSPRSLILVETAAGRAFDVKKRVFSGDQNENHGLDGLRVQVIPPTMTPCS